MSKCLVTGCAGFIGSHVADALIEAGHEVIGIDNLSEGKLSNVNPKVTFIRADISELDIVEIPQTDYVFHLAAMPRVQFSIDNPMMSHHHNVNATLVVLEYCIYNNAKLVFSSSSSIYEGVELPTKEDSKIEPVHPYALQKYICEQYIVLYQKLYKLDYAILRYFNVYGERCSLDGPYPLVIGIFLNQRENFLPLTITGDGEQRRDFTYVKDVAQANLMAMDWNGTYNIGNGQNYSVNEIADMISKDKVYIEPRLEVRATLADNSKARSMGWEPKMDLKRWLDDQD